MMYTAAITVLIASFASAQSSDDRVFDVEALNFTHFSSGYTLDVPTHAAPNQILSELSYEIRRNDMTRSGAKVYFALGYPYEDYFKPSPAVLIATKELTFMANEKTHNVAFTLTPNDLIVNGTEMFGAYRIFLSVDCQIKDCNSSSTVFFRMIQIAKSSAAPLVVPLDTENACEGKAAGTFCVAPAYPLLGLNHTLLSCPSGKTTVCEAGHYCGEGTGDPVDKATCQAM